MVLLRRRLTKWLAAGSAATVILLLLVSIAAAHTTTVVQSSPADGATVSSSPAQVTAQFSEELDTKKSMMQVFDAVGQQVSQGNGKVDLNDPDHKTMFATLPAALPDGVYNVAFTSLSAVDGHTTQRHIVFKVGAGPAPPALRRVLRLTGLILGVLAAGLLAATALSGHAPALAPDTVLAVVVDWAHLAAASLWVGGLLALAVGLLPPL